MLRERRGGRAERRRIRATGRRRLARRRRRVARLRGARLAVSRDRGCRTWRLGLRGAYQRDNAGTALAALGRGARAVTGRRGRRAPRVASVRWPGRLESSRGAADDSRRGAQRDGVAALARELPALLGGRRLHLLFAVMGDKDWRSMVERLAPLCASAVVTEVLPPRGAAAAPLAGAFRAALSGDGRARHRRAWQHRRMARAGLTAIAGRRIALPGRRALRDRSARRRGSSRDAAGALLREPAAAPGARPRAGVRRGARGRRRRRLRLGAQRRVHQAAKANVRRWRAATAEEEITVDAESLSYDKKTDTISASRRRDHPARRIGAARRRGRAQPPDQRSRGARRRRCSPARRPRFAPAR